MSDKETAANDNMKKASLPLEIHAADNGFIIQEAPRSINHSLGRCWVADSAAGAGDLLTELLVWRGHGGTDG